VVSRRVEKRIKARLAVDDMNTDCSRDGLLRSCRLSENRKSEADETVWSSSKKVRLPG
jgi:hypothetical protein